MVQLLNEVMNETSSVYFKNILNSIKDFFNGIIHPLVFIFIEVAAFVCSIYKAPWLLNSGLSVIRTAVGAVYFLDPFFFLV